MAFDPTKDEVLASTERKAGYGVLRALLARYNGGPLKIRLLRLREDRTYVKLGGLSVKEAADVREMLSTLLEHEACKEAAGDVG